MLTDGRTDGRTDRKSDAYIRPATSRCDNKPHPLAAMFFDSLTNHDNSNNLGRGSTREHLELPSYNEISPVVSDKIFKVYYV